MTFYENAFDAPGGLIARGTSRLEAARTAYHGTDRPEQSTICQHSLDNLPTHRSAPA